MTTRDDAWNAALEQIVKTGKFKLTDLPFEQEESHTVTRVLREMERHGWLTRESKYSDIWRVGHKAEMLLNISEEAIEQAKK